MKETRSHQKYVFKTSLFRASVLVPSGPRSEQEAIDLVNSRLFEEAVESEVEIPRFTSADVTNVIGINEPLCEGVVTFERL